MYHMSGSCGVSWAEHRRRHVDWRRPVVSVDYQRHVQSWIPRWRSQHNGTAGMSGKWNMDSPGRNTVQTLVHLSVAEWFEFHCILNRMLIVSGPRCHFLHLQFLVQQQSDCHSVVLWVLLSALSTYCLYCYRPIIKASESSLFFQLISKHS